MQFVLQVCLMYHQLIEEMSSLLFTFVTCSVRTVTVNTAYCNITKMTKMQVTHEERSITNRFF